MKLLFLILSFISTNVYADSSCKLASDKILHIGCSIDCGMLNRMAIKRMAKKLDYNIELHYLSESKKELTDLDGLIIPGGEDLNPKNYKKYLSTDFYPDLMSKKHLAKLTDTGEVRDQLEIPLIDKILNEEELQSFPLLGICRGMQAITVTSGIPLYLDIDTELGIPNRLYTLDKVSTTKKDSQISKMLDNSFYGVELHHQGLRLDYFRHYKNRWPNIEVTASSNKNKIAEVIEFNNRPILGVQFHPEYTFGKVQKSIFEWILTKSCEYKNSKEAL